MKLKIEIDIPNGDAFDLAKIFHQYYDDTVDHDKGNVAVIYNSKICRGGEVAVYLFCEHMVDTEQIEICTVDALQRIFNYV